METISTIQTALGFKKCLDFNVFFADDAYFMPFYWSFTSTVVFEDLKVLL